MRTKYGIHSSSELLTSWWEVSTSISQEITAAHLTLLITILFRELKIVSYKLLYERIIQRVWKQSIIKIRMGTCCHKEPEPFGGGLFAEMMTKEDKKRMQAEMKKAGMNPN